MALFVFGYLGNSPLVEMVAFKQNGNLSMTTTKAYDFVNRLTSISSANSAQAVVSRHAYLYNTANQRTRATLADSTYWVYEYDALGQVKSGKKYWSDGSPVPGQQFEYGCDDIGNRKFAGAGGDQWGRGLQFEHYTNDLEGLNQYAQRTVRASLDVLGTANANATVTVNNQPAYRKGEYFHKALSVDNGGSAVWQDISAVAVLRNGSNADIVTNYTGNAFVAKTPEQFLYDADGNLTNDGRWTYTWDGENRLTGMEAHSDIPSGAKLKLEFAYDYQGRRVSKKVSTCNGSSYQLSTETKFVYEGWNLLAALAPDCTVRTSFTWGLDLSGTMQGAGGVGGLLAVRDQQSAACHFVAYDGNGNVSALINATDGAVAAQYEYGPFGEGIRASGPACGTNPFGFSTKYQDKEMNLLYYGYRYYDPNTGRWLSRDPIEEPGFELIQGSLESSIANDIPEYTLEELDENGNPSQYTGSLHEMAFVNNDPANSWDFLGMAGGGKGSQPKSPKPPKPPKKKNPYKVKNVKITFYCSCKICCGPNAHGICADGTKACEGTLAADWSKFPKGSKISFTGPDGTKIEGTVHDKGGAIKGNHLDVWCASHKDAKDKGV